MDSMIKGVPWGKARETQAKHGTAWCWQPTLVQLLWMLCTQVLLPQHREKCQVKTGQTRNMRMKGNTHVGFPLAQTSDLQQ